MKFYTDFYNDKIIPFLLVTLAPIRGMLRAGAKRSKNITPEFNFETDHSQKIIAQHQLEEFNSQWLNLQTSNPFYKWWKETHHLPAAIESLEELNSFPVLTREVLTEKRDLVFCGHESSPVVSTGGSTSTPLRLPTSAEDVARAAQSNRMMLRLANL